MLAQPTIPTRKCLSEGADTPELREASVAVDVAVLHDLQARLARTRWPDQIEDSGWEYGVPVAYMRELVDDWQTGCDWRAQERPLNRLPQFVTTIERLEIHFVDYEGDIVPIEPATIVANPQKHWILWLQK